MRYIFFLFLSSCAWSNLSYQDIDKKIDSYVVEFENECKQRFMGSAWLVDMPDGYFGHCANYGKNNPLNYIKINKKFWETASEVQRRILIFHELGHCVLDRRHDDNLIQLGIYVNAPKSLMYSIPFGYESVFFEYRDYYYKELCW